MTYSVEFRGTSVLGAHYLQLRGQGPSAGFARGLELWRQDLTDMARMTAFQTTRHLEYLGDEQLPDGVGIYLAGSVELWQAMHTIAVPIPQLQHLARGLQAHGVRTESVVIESRALATASYEVISRGDWPFATHGKAALTQKVRVIAKLATGQEQGLHEMINSALRTDRWGVNEVPATASCTSRGGWLELSWPISAGLLMETLYIWAQAYWVDLERVEWL